MARIEAPVNMLVVDPVPPPGQEGKPSREHRRFLDQVAKLSVDEAAIADVTTPDAIDLASAIDLANANKAALNTVIAALRTAGLIVT